MKKGFSQVLSLKSLNIFFLEMFNDMNTLTETRAPDPIQASCVPSMARKP